MLRVISLNLNGIRSAAKRNFLPWMRRQKADVVCLQEVKAQLADLPPALAHPRGYHAFFHCADRKGYSGVAIYSRREPDHVELGIGVPEIDREGRYLRCDYGDLSVVSVYVPSGSAGPHRQQAKFAFLDAFRPHLQRLRRSQREFILCGDWNIAHREIDLKNWRANQKNSGFLPEERAWLSAVFDDLGWVDVFRQLDPRPERYTWWSNRGRAWEKNVGWRIDYQIATPGIAARARATSIYSARRFSDHAPLTVDYDVPCA